MAEPSTDTASTARRPEGKASEPRDVDKLIADRRHKRDRLREEFHVDPYGRRIDGLVSLLDARSRYDAAADQAHRENPEADRRPRVRLAGRVMQQRVLGNLIFLSLRDATGDLQAAVSKKQAGREAFRLAKLADLSDIVVVEGPLGKTKTGEITVWAQPPAPPEAQPADAAARDAEGGAAFAGFTIATKSLAPPPGKYHGLRDAELRYRKRYVDLYANPQVMRTFTARGEILKTLRDLLTAPPDELAALCGGPFVEVETPMMQAVPGGAAARPFTTHHNALNVDLYLRIAPELYLKRLLVGGMPRVFEINRNFRNEGLSPRHNPEFTMLELYQAFGDYRSMMALTQTLLHTLAAQHVERIAAQAAEHTSHATGAQGGTLEAEGTEAGPTRTRGAGGSGGVTLPFMDHRIDYTPPFRRASYHELFEEHNGFASTDHQRLVDRANQLGIDVGPRPRAQPGAAAGPPRGETAVETGRPGTASDGGNGGGGPDHDVLLQEVWEATVEDKLIQPTFVVDYPASLCPLTRQKAGGAEGRPRVAERFELYVAGMEIANAYTELNDPDAQEANFRRQIAGLDEDESTFRTVDEDFLEALRVGMPPAGGLGVGVDRLVMLLTNQRSIRDVILFPMMRPQAGA